jgi:hypothetical protein
LTSFPCSYRKQWVQGAVRTTTQDIKKQKCSFCYPTIKFPEIKIGRIIGELETPRVMIQEGTQYKLLGSAKDIMTSQSAKVINV